uniref:(northern house mosquito) hypothetical protein n=1 Tax=Culex pipiens TaxID=7175 RepID=A0A8D8NNH3_CULPI
MFHGMHTSGGIMCGIGFSSIHQNALPKRNTQFRYLQHHHPRHPIAIGNRRRYKTYTHKHTRRDSIGLINQPGIVECTANTLTDRALAMVYGEVSHYSVEKI